MRALAVRVVRSVLTGVAQSASAASETSSATGSSGGTTGSLGGASAITIGVGGGIAVDDQAQAVLIMKRATARLQLKTSASKGER